MPRVASLERASKTEAGKPGPICADPYYIRRNAVIRCQLEPLHVGVHQSGSTTWYSGQRFDGGTQD